MEGLLSLIMRIWLAPLGLAMPLGACSP